MLDALLPRYRFELAHPDREVRHSETMVVGPEPGRMAVRIRRRTEGIRLEARRAPPGV